MRIWKKVIPADIPQETRDTLDRYGEDAVAIILAQAAWPDGLDIREAIPRRTLPGGDENAQRRKLERARDWLKERHQIHENRERRLEILEWAIVALIVVEILLSVVGPHGCNQPKASRTTTRSATIAAPAQDARAPDPLEPSSAGGRPSIRWNLLGGGLRQQESSRELEAVSLAVISLQVCCPRRREANVSDSREGVAKT